MQELNYLTMLTAVRECVNKEGFRVGIFASARCRLYPICHELLESMDEEERKEWFRATGSNDNFFIEFWNGSYIKIISASDHGRGQAFHMVLCEPGIDYCAEKLKFQNERR